MKENKTMLIVDFNNMVFLSYYGSPLINSKGMNVNAVVGFFKKLRSIKALLNPDQIVFASDLSRSKTFRRQLYPEYKAQRKKTDDNVIHQMSAISDILLLAGYPIINNELYEGDDIMGMLSRYASDNNMSSIIASSDKDMYQLITDNTLIYSPRIGEIIDLEYMDYKFSLTPDQWIELKMIQGDPSDNIPGIRGIGTKGAMSLMQQYGSINDIYANISNIKPSTANSLNNGKQSIDLMRTLVTILTDYKLIGIDDTMISKKIANGAGVHNMITELEVESIRNIVKYEFMYWGD